MGQGQHLIRCVIVTIKEMQVIRIGRGRHKISIQHSSIARAGHDALITALGHELSAEYIRPMTSYMLDEFLPGKGICNCNRLVITAAEQVLAIITPGDSVYAPSVDIERVLEAKGLHKGQAICCCSCNDRLRNKSRR